MEIAAAPTWDLRPLYDGPDDPRLDADLAAAAADATAFAAHHRGRLATPSAVALAAAIDAFEAIVERARRPGFYAALLSAADTQAPGPRRLLDRTREAAVGIANTLTFFTVELKEMPDDVFGALVADPALAERRHWLSALRKLRPHTLSETEERLLNQKNLTGRDALVELYDELTGSIRFTVDGHDLSAEEVLALLYDGDRSRRERAFTALLDGHAVHGIALAGILSALANDHRVECDLRHFPDVVTPTHLDNEVRAETVDAMMAATERHYGLAQEYFRLKARLLDLPRLKNSDVYAPLGAGAPPVSWADARALVLEAFEGFSPRFAGLARDFFTNGWIDAALRPGKRPGAFCAAHAPGGNPFILLSYTGTPRDVATLAHELGHGVHDRLAAGRRFLDFSPPLTLAETASTFAEMVLMRAQLAREPRREVRREILCAKIEDTIATVFRQNVLTRFEMAVHARRREGPVDARTLGDLWWTENARLYGDAVEMIPPYRWGWAYIPHFIHSRFYCYAYVFGELLVLALYQSAQGAEDAFLPRYLELLAAGGSEAPDVLLRRLGFEIDDPAFWERGFGVMRGLLDELVATLDA